MGVRGQKAENGSKNWHCQVVPSSASSEEARLPEACFYQLYKLPLFWSAHLLTEQKQKCYLKISGDFKVKQKKRRTLERGQEQMQQFVFKLMLKCKYLVELQTFPFRAFFARRKKRQLLARVTYAWFLHFLISTEAFSEHSSSKAI